MPKKCSERLSMHPGVRFGRWTWPGAAPEKIGHNNHYTLLCDCGRTKTVCYESVKSGRSTSCGCLNAEVLSKRSKTHGISRTSVYAVWNAMKNRATNPKYKHTKDYLGRGVGVCDRWLTFENFFEDMGCPLFKGALLERIDNDGPYSQENCRWASRTDQNRNTRKNLWVDYSGDTRLFVELVEELGLPYRKIYQRIHTYGWTLERALTTP